jgi:hypothetical protein
MTAKDFDKLMMAQRRPNPYSTGEICIFEEMMHHPSNTLGVWNARAIKFYEACFSRSQKLLKMEN